MHTEHMLTDRFGPRMTGTPNHEAAVDMGHQRDHRVGYEERPPGSVGFRPSRLAERSRLRIHHGAGQGEPEFEVLAWTPSTKGTVTGSALQLIPRTVPSSAADQ